MRFQTPLVPARLIRRYKRFLADCLLEDGRGVTAHCANPGSMTGLAEPGARIWLACNDDPRRKLRFAWALVDHGNGHFTGVDTGLPNSLLRGALHAQAVPGLEGYTEVRPEVRYGDGSRVDFLLTGGGLPDTYLEVKSVTLSRRPGLAEFPNSVTARGTRHLGDLAAMAGRGARAVPFYLVQRTDCSAVAAAADIDPAYAAALDTARAAGVEVMAWDCAIDTQGIALRRPLRVQGDSSNAAPNTAPNTAT
jgi:sugar fermentation stimulation protein A